MLSALGPDNLGKPDLELVRQAWIITLATLHHLVHFAADVGQDATETDWMAKCQPSRQRYTMIRRDGSSDWNPYGDQREGRNRELELADIPVPCDSRCSHRGHCCETVPNVPNSLREIVGFS